MYTVIYKSLRFSIPFFWEYQSLNFPVVQLRWRGVFSLLSTVYWNLVYLVLLESNQLWIGKIPDKPMSQIFMEFTLKPFLTVAFLGFCIKCLLKYHYWTLKNVFLYAVMLKYSRVTFSGLQTGFLGPVLWGSAMRRGSTVYEFF